MFVVIRAHSALKSVAKAAPVIPLDAIVGAPYVIEAGLTSETAAIDGSRKD